MSTALTERVLELWERGTELDLNARANLALVLMHNTGERANGITLYERDRELVELRRALFGSSMDGVVQCPACSVDFEMHLDLSSLQDAVPAPDPVRVERDGYVAIVRPPRGEDLRALEGDVAAAAEQVFARCVIAATRGLEPIAPSELPPAVRAEASASLFAKGMESPSLDLVCGECAHAWRAPLDIARALLSELDGWVARLLDDVHRIAAVYHWSERDIIAMPVRRRLYYLEAIG
jgi:hypothetical protein